MRAHGVCAAGLCFVLAACGDRSATFLSDKPTQRKQLWYEGEIDAARLTPEFVAQTDFIRDHGLTRAGKVRGYVRRDLVAHPEDWGFITGGDPIDVLSRADFTDYNELTDALQTLQRDHAELVTLSTAGQSVQGRELWYVRLTSTRYQHKPKLLYIANMHGDETAGRELLLRLAQELADTYASDPRVARLLDTAEIFLMPSMNPDGFEAQTRFNADGADLNRDFPEATHNDVDAERNHQPETIAVMRLHAQHHFVAALNFHGGSVVFNLPWDAKANSSLATRFGDDAFIAAAGRRYADANATMRRNNAEGFTNGLTYGYEWYQVLGGMQDWSIIFRNSIHATVELSNAKWPASSDLQRIWQENRESLVSYLEDALFGVHIRAVDETGAVLTIATTVHVSSQPDRQVQFPQGYASRPVSRAMQNRALDVHVSAAGFRESNIQLVPNVFDGQYTPVTLRRQR